MLFVMVPQQTTDGFEAFWAAYPVHKARRDAEKAWRQVKGASHQAAILAAIAAQKAERLQPGWHPQWPYPASWLRAARWEDEVALSARLTLAPEPCTVCGETEDAVPGPEGARCRNRWACNTRWLAREKAKARA